MQVETATAPARAHLDGRQFWFCSDRCRSRFTQAPDRFARRGASGAGVSTTAAVTDAIPPAKDADASMRDVVCGMTVEPSTAAPQRAKDDVAFYFCSDGCASRFDDDPERFSIVRLAAR